jgi:hypothetical protein
MVGFTGKPETGCLLRLDIDYDLEWAVQTARINHRHGIVATYFVLMGSPLYNPGSAAGRRALTGLIGLGQRVALHHHHGGDHGKDSQDGGALDLGRLEQDFRRLAELAPGAERVVSWHNPAGDLNLLNTAAAAAGFVSAYDPRVFGSDRYISDSNLGHGAPAIAAFVETSPRPLVQVLLHPCNWVAGGTGMDQVLRRTLRHKIEIMLATFDENRVWHERAGIPVIAEIRAAAWYREDDRDDKDDKDGEQ